LDPPPSDKDIVERYSVKPPNVHDFGHQAYYQHVVECPVSKRAALVDGLEGRKSLELISALCESIETGKEVFLRFCRETAVWAFVPRPYHLSPRLETFQYY
jgi:hypothetical protein